MVHKLQNGFLFAGAVIFFVMGMIFWQAARQIPAAFSLLHDPDPVLFLSGRSVIGLVAGLMLALSAFLLIADPQRSRTLQLWLTAWLTGCLLTYQAYVTAAQMPNLLAGINNLTATLPLSPRDVNRYLSLVWTWLLAGSLLLLLLKGVARWRPRPQAANSDGKISPPGPAAL